jgi:hypothetical protein
MAATLRKQFHFYFATVLLNILMHGSAWNEVWSALK